MLGGTQLDGQAFHYFIKDEENTEQYHLSICSPEKDLIIVIESHVMEPILQNVTHIELKHFSNLTNKQIDSLTSYTNNLKSFNICLCNGNYEVSAISKLLKRHEKTLTTLSFYSTMFHNDDFMTIFNELPSNVTELNVYCDDLEPSTLSNMLHNNKQILSVEYDLCDKICCDSQICDEIDEILSMRNSENNNNNNNNKNN